MSLDSTSKEYNFQRSIKKLFLDFSTANNIPVYFEEQDDVPVDENGDKYSKWVLIIFGTRDVDTVAEQTIKIFIFTRKDSESDDLIQLSDIVFSLFHDSETGVLNIDLYDTDPTTWVKIGGILPFTHPFSEIYHSKDNTKYRQMNVDCKWGAK